ncbi:MAG: hypothetical protein HDT47_05265 [Ruminococcaceae bacterium]|nr:hypothetical protein [Oscillospiraceae bacterium]
MQYSNYLGIKEGFQASINLEYDLNRIDKIKSYIPTEQSVKILGDFLRSFYFNNEPQSRATILVGPYGKGKSHLLLILTALTSLDLASADKKKNKIGLSVLNEVCKKISSIDKEIGVLAKTIVESKIRTLPVIVNSNSNDINQSFMLAIQDALSRANLQQLLPSTYFDSALATIEKWKISYPEAYKTLRFELKKVKKNIDDLTIGLKQFSREYYDLFCTVYTNIAVGTEFNPLTNMDIVKMYIDIADALRKQTQYTGINIIFDEFSKFLEANLDKSKMLNFKIIQDMTEAATRSGETQIHFTCVTHKGILDYSSSDSFKAVEGRFKTIHFISSSEQSYELIANAIVKKSTFYDFRKENDEAFQRAINCYSAVGVFNELSDDIYKKKIVYGCFPLSPISAYALLHVSEIVGQNERTLFTFLSQNDDYSLKSFVEKKRDSFEFITVDYIYDYFEELFKKEIFNNKVYSSWSKTSAAIKKATSNTQIKILKTIAIINIIADDKLKAIPVHIKACLMLDDKVFSKAIKELLKKQIVNQRESLEYVLLTDNGVNVNTAIENNIKKNNTKYKICEILEQNYSLGFAIPREYNDRFTMFRYFKKIYIEATTFIRIRNAKQLLLEYQVDGLIINILDFDGTKRESVLEKIKTFTDTPNIVICLSKLSFKSHDLLKRAIAISQLKIENESDSDYLKELEIFDEDNKKRIKTIIDDLFGPSSKHSEFFNCEKQLTITNNVSLSRELSTICNNLYNLTPIINNEMVNKKVLNTQNMKGRDIVVAWILEHSDNNEIPTITGYGPEVSVFNSTFKYTGLYKSANVEDKGITSVLNIIKRFTTNCEKKKVNFSDLYQTLYAPPYGVRKGLIPLFLAYVLRQYKNNVVLYFKDKEVELSSGILNSLNDSPENYYLLIETGTQEKEKHLNDLEKLFENNTDIKDSSVNKSYSVVKAMQNWVRSLPEYSKKCKKLYKNGKIEDINRKTLIIRSELLKFEINARELLFQTFVSGIDNSNYIESFNSIRSAKETLDSHLATCKKELGLKLTTIFVQNYKGTLSNAAMIWYKKLPDYTKNHMFDNNSNQLLSIVKRVCSYDDDALIDDLVTAFTAIQIADWNDSVADKFIESISESIQRITEYRETENTSKQSKLLIQDGDSVYEKNFSVDDISPLGKTALNNLRSVFDEYNDALESNEQLAILAKLIKEIIH